MNYKDKLKKLRKEKGISQAKLGEITGLNPRTIRRYESGEIIPPLKTMRKVFNVFGYKTDYSITKRYY